MGKGNSGLLIRVATYRVRQSSSRLLGLLLLGIDSDNTLVPNLNEVFGQLGMF